MSFIPRKIIFFSGRIFVNILTLNLALVACIFLILSCATNLASASPIANIKSVEYPSEKKIYFGPLLDRGTTVLNFKFTSFDSSRTLAFYQKHPTYLINSYPDQALTDKDHFDTVSPAAFPFFLKDKNLSENLSVKFSTINVPTSSYGRKEARLILGLVSPEDTTTNIISDTFYLIGKKTKLFVDWYDDIVNFDTVLIHKNQPVSLELKAKNTTTYKINAVNQKLNLISQKLNDDEFSIEEKKYPLVFYPGDNFVYRNWVFNYKPLDTFPDTAIVYLLFQPLPDEVPEKIDTAKVKLVGVGATHSLQIKDADCNYFSDTIYVGATRIGENKTVKIKLQNYGNLNYALLSQNIYDEISDEPIDFFQIETAFLNKNQELLAGDTASFEIKFSPDKKGTFIARCVLENNFSQRKIHSSSKDDYKKTFVLQGIGVAPTLTLPIDTMNFGNVSYANAGINCSTSKDTTIQIYNTGNANLIISDISTNNSAFIPEYSELIVPAGSMANLPIKFLATYPEKTTVANLFFETNEIRKNTSEIVLIGSSVAPIEADLHIPHLKTKPGTLLNIPILLDNKQNIELNKYIKTYSFDVLFNSTLLEFVNFNKINTASEGCDVSVTQENNSIKINAGRNHNTFAKNDTLLILIFKTFIGNSSSSELALQNSKVGNGNCEDFMKLNVSNGSYSIDSICGLEYKLQTNIISKFNFEANFEQATSNINIEFSVPYRLLSNIELMNSFGENIIKEEYPALSGNWQRKINTNLLPAGVYFCRFSSGIFTKTIPVLITK